MQETLSLLRRQNPQGGTFEARWVGGLLRESMVVRFGIGVRGRVRRGCCCGCRAFRISYVSRFRLVLWKSVNDEDKPVLGIERRLLIIHLECLVVTRLRVRETNFSIVWRFMQ